MVSPIKISLTLLESPPMLINTISEVRHPLPYPTQIQLDTKF
ncbi:hypothetical protein AALP_AA1G155300 [Arabis alpina]|uniref:Uncharacterized protein n=1 Tax=Arabis alpina TaxID=50452 RepID=A0A087HNF2_ARAAL|nr:hypothetical protein AALP_AA1G155300 [Arabis alpina]